jgi:hypothetical protein
MNRIFLGILALLVGCSPTFTVSTYKDPAVPGLLQDAQRVAVVAMFTDPAIRKMTEDKLTHHNPAFEVTYPLLSASIILGYPSVCKEFLISHGFDYVLSMGLQKIQLYPRQYILKSYRIETKLFDLRRNRVIWYSVTESNSPDRFSVAALEVVQQVIESLKKEGFCVAL